MLPTSSKTWLSVLLFLLFALSLTGSLFFKESRLWMDEILSYLLISDPSLTHLNNAIVSALDANPPLFTNLYWLIAHGINGHIIFLKAVSIVLFAGTLTLFYRYTTQLTGRPVGNFYLIAGLAALTYLNLTLATQIRAYALFFCIGFGYLTLAHRLTRQPGNPRLLLAHAGVGLLLVLTHNFGLFYLAATGAFFLLLGLWARDWRYRYVLGTFAGVGLVWLVAWYPSFAVQARAGVPHSWIPLPTWRSFFRVVGELAPTVSNRLEGIGGDLPLFAMLRTLALAALFGYIALPRLRQGFNAALADPAFMFYLLAGFVYGATITIALTVSLVHTSVFISRYLWLNQLLVIYQLVYAFHQFVGGRSWAQPGRLSGRVLTGLVGLVPVYALVLGGYLFTQNQKNVLAPVALMACVDNLDAQYPVFMESSLFFMPVWYYNRHRPVHFLLDYASAFDARNDPGATVGYYTLTSVREKYGVNAVLSLSDFNAQKVPHFYVFDEPWNYQIERFINQKAVRVVGVMPTPVNGIRILECVFNQNAPR